MLPIGPLIAEHRLIERIIVGEQDTITPIKIAEEMKNMMLNADLEVISSAGHLSNIENMQEFNQKLLNWLQKRF